jgi:RNA recognition motif-containing protein
VIVIFCNIPTKTTLSELLEFALYKNDLVSRLMKRSVEIANYDILEVMDEQTGRQEFHGLVTYAHLKDAHRAIAKLNGKKLHGKPITVREFQHRSPGDRRIKPRAQGLNRPEERRRKQLQISSRNNSPTVRGMKEYAKKHGG